MLSNGYGSFETTVVADMAEHDACPRWLRDVANYSVSKWSSKHLRKDAGLLKNLPGGGRNLLVMGLMRQEQEDTLAHYGPSHPEAGGQL
jgi:hypothetical protein